MAWECHSLFIQSCTDGHLNYFLFWLMNMAAIYIFINKVFRISRCGLVYPYWNFYLFFIFEVIVVFWPTVFRNTNCGVSQKFCATVSIFDVVIFFIFHHEGGWIVVVHGFNFFFIDNQLYWILLHIRYLYSFLVNTY